MLDEILRQQKCTKCFLYLSVAPTRVNVKGEKICGRCATNDDSMKLCVSMYDLVSQHYLYKCVNHYEGCKSLLGVCVTASHESFCNKPTRCCPFCSFQGNWCQITRHCEYKHPNQLTWNGSFQISANRGFCKKIIFPLGDSIFLINSLDEDDMFQISIQPEVVNDSVQSHIEIKFFQDGNTVTHMTSLNQEYKGCFSKSLQYLRAQFGYGGDFENSFQCQICFCGPATNPYQKILENFWRMNKVKKIQLNENRKQIDDLREKHAANEETVKLLSERLTLQEEQTITKEKQLNDLKKTLTLKEQCLRSTKKYLKMLRPCFKCMKCGTGQSETRFFCREMHCFCSKCLQRMCIICNVSSEFFELKNATTPCNWELCDEQIPFENYSEHVRNCTFRPYKCPNPCSKTIYSAEKLKTHWHYTNFKLLDSKMISLIDGDNRFYWLLNGDLYFVNYVLDLGKQKIMKGEITEVDVLSKHNKFSLMYKDKGKYYFALKAIIPSLKCVPYLSRYLGINPLFLSSERINN